MPQLVVEMTSEESKLWQGLQRVIAGEGDLEKALQKVVGASKQVGNEYDANSRAAQRLYDATRTPQEQYNRSLEKYNRLLEDGRINQETHARAVEMAKHKLEEAGKAGEEAWKKGAESAKGFITEIAGIASAAGLAIKALEEMQRVREEAAQDQRSSEKGLSALKQLAGGKQENFEKLLEEAKQTYQEGGAKDLNDAAQTTFMLHSIGAGDQRQFFSQLSHSGAVSNPEQLARSAQTLRTAMGGDKTGDFRTLTSEAFAAAENSPFSVEHVLQATAQSGQGARALGLGVPEMMAGTSLLSQASGSAEMAGTQMAALMKALRKIGAGKTGGGEDTGIDQSIDEVLGGAEKEKLEKLDSTLEEHKRRIDTKWQHEQESLAAHLAHEQKSLEAKAHQRHHRLSPDARAAEEKTNQETYQKKLTEFHQEHDRELAHFQQQHDQEAAEVQEKASARKAKQVSVDFKGKDLFGMLHQVRDLGLDDAQLMKLFGRQEGMKAYETLMLHEGEVRGASGQIAAAGKEDRAGAAMRLRDPGLDAAAAVRKAEADEKLSAEGQGTLQNVTAAVRSHLFAQGRRKAPGALTEMEIANDKLMAWASDKVGTSGMKGDLRGALGSGQLNDDPALKHQALQVLGNDDPWIKSARAAGNPNLKDPELTEQVKRMADGIDKLVHHAETQPQKRTLGNPGVDK